MRELKITEREAGQRLDRYLHRYLPDAPSSFLQRMLRKKNITRNGARCAGGDRLAAGDVLSLFLSDETLAKFGAGRSANAPAGRPLTTGGNPLPPKGMMLRAEELSLPPERILFEDDHFVFVDKPAGMLSQPDASGCASLCEALRATFGGAEAEGGFPPSPANRLDRNTSGIVLCGRSAAAARFLGEALQSGLVEKTYLAAVRGPLPREGVHRVFYRKDAARNRVLLSPDPSGSGGEMVTGISHLLTKGRDHLLRVRLMTGRPHQIRAHLAYLSCPVLGDPKYGDRAANREMAERYGISRQMLHAYELRFGEVEGPFSHLADTSFTAPLPEDMRRFLAGFPGFSKLGLL